MKTIKVGVIGAGAIASEHINGPNTYDGAEVIALADTSQKRVKATAKQYNVPRTYSGAGAHRSEDPGRDLPVFENR